jgi:DNA-binding transcriptional LysR family regulator
MSTLNELWDTTRMQLLVALARHRTLSEAARSIGLGQSGASEHLRLLEIAAGEQLARRGKGGLQLTEAGKILAAHAALALDCLRAGEDEIDGRKRLEAGSLRLGASHVPGAYILPAVIPEFSRRYPGVEIDVSISSTDSVLDTLASGLTSIAVVCAHVNDPRLTVTQFVDDEIVGVASPGLLELKNRCVEVGALDGATLLLQEKGSSTRELAVGQLPLDAVRWQAVWELGSIDAIKRNARAGLGVGFLSRHVIVDELTRGELVAFRLSDTPPMRGHVSVVNSRSVPVGPAERTFVESLARYGDEIVPPALPDVLEAV